MFCVLTKDELRSMEQLAQRLESKGLVSESEMLRNILLAGSSRREVRASIAARVFHVTSQTIRNWVKGGLLPGRIDETGHVFVQASALAPVLEMDAAMPEGAEATPDLTDDEILAEIKAYRTERRSQRRLAS